MERNVRRCMRGEECAKNGGSEGISRWYGACEDLTAHGRFEGGGG